MKEIDGDIIKLAEEGLFDVIIHGCNCYCQMGKGIALTIKNKYPEAYAIDCLTNKADKSKLGSFTFVEVMTKTKHSFTIINAYTQFHWRGNGVKVNYDAIRSVMNQIKIKYSGKRIGYPLIGAGLAGGDWKIISDIINEELDNEHHTLVRFKP